MSQNRFSSNLFLKDDVAAQQTLKMGPVPEAFMFCVLFFCAVTKRTIYKVKEFLNHFENICN